MPKVTRKRRNLGSTELSTPPPILPLLVAAFWGAPLPAGASVVSVSFMSSCFGIDGNPIRKVRRVGTDVLQRFSVAIFEKTLPSFVRKAHKGRSTWNLSCNCYICSLHWKAVSNVNFIGHSPDRSSSTYMINFRRFSKPKKGKTGGHFYCSICQKSVKIHQIPDLSSINHHIP